MAHVCHIYLLGLLPAGFSFKFLESEFALVKCVYIVMIGVYTCMPACVERLFLAIIKKTTHTHTDTHCQLLPHERLDVYWVYLL